MTDNLTWRISTFSGSNGSCVEVADDGELIHVRNSNARDAGTLHLTRAEMAAFVRGCAAGEFDDLAWTPGEDSRQGFDPAGMLAGSVVRYTGWMGFLVQEKVDGIQYDTPEEAQAVVDEAWLNKEIADLDAGQ